VEHATTTQLQLYLAIRQPLDFAQRVAKMRHAEADARVLARQRDLALTGVEFEVRSRFADLDEARRRLQASERGQATARSWLTAMLENLDVGTAEPRDLADAARKYIELRLLHLKAIHDVNVGLAALRRAADAELDGPTRE
jgi:outer membrane protein TolC